MSKNNNTNKNSHYRIITAEEPTSYFAEAYRRIKVALGTFSTEKLKVIQICSAMPGDGKTTTILNLAFTYAESGKKVIILDLDLRKPKIHRAFRTENTKGIVNYISGEVEKLSEVIKHSKYSNIDFINAGTIPLRPSVLLESERMKRMIDSLKNYYDVVLIDDPPVFAATDCCIIAKYCDGAIFQISHRNTEKKIAVDAVKTLKQNGTNILGCVFSEVEEASDSYRYGY